MHQFTCVPRLAPAYRFVRASEEVGYLLGDREHHLVQDSAVVAVLDRVDGLRTKREVLLDAGKRIGDVSALRAFHTLEVAGYLWLDAPDRPPEELSFWHAHGVHSPSALSQLERTKVVVHAGEPGLAEEARIAFRGAGLTVQPAGEATEPTARGVLTVWVVDDYLSPALAGVNRAQLESGGTWALVNPTRATPFIGPIFEPGRGPCWQCLSHRIRGNRPVREYVHRQTGQRASLQPAPAHLGASRQVALSLTGLLLAQHLTGVSPERSLGGSVLSLDPIALRSTRHHLGRRPQCPTCGDPSLMRFQMERPVELTAVAKHRPHLGGYRRVDPHETAERFFHLVDPHLGALLFLSQLPRSQQRSAPVFVSGYAAPVNGPDGIQSSVRLCAGKGRTMAQAQASALCEGLERRSGLYEGDEARRRASAEELKPAALTPEVLECFSPRQYALRTEFNARNRDPALWVPQPLAQTTPIDWAPAWSLSLGQRRYVPLAYLFEGCPHVSDAEYCRPCGNGVAAGTCREEAILQALLELVERDAIAVWWYNRIDRPAIDPLSLPSALAALLSDYQADGAKAWLLDLTHDLGIPVYVAVGCRPQGGREVYSVGFGCHLDPLLAVERALTELHQLGDGNHPGTGEPFLNIAQLTTDERRFLAPAKVPAVDVTTVSGFDGDDLRMDVQECITRLGEKGLEVIAVEKTRPDLGLHVVQVIVPGLRHMRPRLAPGRLYDVPFQLGWLAAPRTEENLNPVPLVL